MLAIAESISIENRMNHKCLSVRLPKLGVSGLSGTIRTWSASGITCKQKKKRWLMCPPHWLLCWLRSHVFSAVMNPGLSLAPCCTATSKKVLRSVKAGWIQNDTDGGFGFPKSWGHPQIIPNSPSEVFNGHETGTDWLEVPTMYPHKMWPGLIWY